ncbi:MAG: cytochrome c [Proteobacteria bacterium]|nr:cytochrome c [Pseudomonadota bacterium]
MRIILALAFTLAISSAGHAANAKRGALLAAEQCGSCHAIGKSGTSRHLKAPPFRRIANQWPLDQLQEAFAEGIVTGHSGMPEFTFSPQEIDDILAHLATLKRR